MGQRPVEEGGTVVISFRRKPEQTRRIMVDSHTDCGHRILELDPDTADIVEALQAKADRLNAENEALVKSATALAASYKRAREGREQRVRELDSNLALAVERADKLEADLGQARDENRRLHTQLATALNTPWPTALTGRPAVLTPAQREDAADDAAWKRIQDGQGDR